MIGIKSWSGYHIHIIWSKVLHTCTYAPIPVHAVIANLDKNQIKMTSTQVKNIRHGNGIQEECLDA